MTDTMTPPTVRTIDAITRDAGTVAYDADIIDATLREPAYRLQNAAANAPADADDYLREVASAHLPALEAAEERAIAAYDAIIARLQDDVRALQRVGFRHDLTRAEQQQLPGAVSIAQVHMANLPADQLEAQVRGAIMAGDRVAMAAYAQLAGVLEGRTMPGKHAVQQAIAEARHIVADWRSRQAVEKVQAARELAQARRQRIIDRANAYRPGSAGSYLERYQFGRDGIQEPIEPTITRDGLIQRSRF